MAIVIRKATREDSYIISEHLFLAMEDILYKFIGMNNSQEAKKFLLYFVEKKNNQYSYKNCFVAESENGVEGSINIYKGADLEILRKPISKYIKKHFKGDFNPENETEAGEYYIDSFGVDPNSQGKGIGSKLLQFVINRYKNKQQPIGLLVDEDNPNAEKLYVNLGFEFVGTKILVGKKMKHLQCKPTGNN